MKNRWFIILFLFFICDLASLYAQEPIVYTFDTIPHIILPQITVRGKFKGSTRRAVRNNRKMTRLEYNVRKVYPYAQLAATKINAINARMNMAKNDSERDKIVKEEYKQLMTAFKEPLMKLSYSQGKILVRLIYRETNNSAFDLIKEYRGTLNAYFWQSVALIFGNNLKADYNPYVGQDADIEDIVQLIIAGF